MKDRLDPAFRQTLVEAARALDAAGLDWCVFGGAAFALHRSTSDPVPDIDVWVPPDAGEALSTVAGLRDCSDGGTARFRSRRRLVGTFGPVPVEILLGFEVRTAGRWEPVAIGERAAIALGDVSITVPERTELARLFRLIGREKDIARADILERDG